MNKEQIIASLNKVANELDNNGLFNEANLITNIMKRLSQYTQETQPPAANALNERAQVGQMSNEQIAQNFIEKNRSNPNLKTAQDFYYEAQRQGLPQPILNSIAALTKAEGYKDQTANVLNETTQVGQMNNTQIAQNFIEKNRLNPNFKTAQDFYYEAQRQGLPQPILNSIAALTKAEGYKDQTKK